MKVSSSVTLIPNGPKLCKATQPANPYVKTRSIVFRPLIYLDGPPTIKWLSRYIRVLEIIDLVLKAGLLVRSPTALGFVYSSSLFFTYLTCGDVWDTHVYWLQDKLRSHEQATQIKVTPGKQDKPGK